MTIARRALLLATATALTTALVTPTTSVAAPAAVPERV
jgi:hypothetical protein